MWQLSECIDGMAEACRALALPVIGGNVSLYNESGGADIDPTPVLGVLGLVDAVHAPPPGLAWSTGDTVVLIGARVPRPTAPSRWRGRAGPPNDGTTAPGSVPPVDFAAHAAACAFVAGLVAAQVAGRRRGTAGARRARRVGRRTGRRTGRNGRRGRGRVPVDVGEAAELFTELPSRFVVATRRPRRAVPPGRCARGAGRRAGPGRRRPRAPWATWSICPSRPWCEAPRGQPRPGPGGTVMPRACATMGDA